MANLVDLAPVHEFDQGVILQDHSLQLRVHLNRVVAEADLDQLFELAHILSHLNLVDPVVLQVECFQVRHFQVEVRCIDEAHASHRKLLEGEQFWNRSDVSEVLFDKAGVETQLLQS